MENKYEVFDWSAEFDIAINKLRAMAHLIEYCDIQECADHVGFDHGFPCLIQDLAEEFAFIVDHMDKEGPGSHFRNSVYMKNKNEQGLKTNDQEIKGYAKLSFDDLALLRMGKDLMVQLWEKFSPEQKVVQLGDWRR